MYISESQLRRIIYQEVLNETAKMNVSSSNRRSTRKNINEGKGFNAAVFAASIVSALVASDMLSQSDKNDAVQIIQKELINKPLINNPKTEQDRTNNKNYEELVALFDELDRAATPLMRTAEKIGDAKFKKQVEPINQHLEKAREIINKAEKESNIPNDNIQRPTDEEKYEKMVRGLYR